MAVELTEIKENLPKEELCRRIKENVEGVFSKI